MTTDYTDSNRNNTDSPANHVALVDLSTTDWTPADGGKVPRAVSFVAAGDLKVDTIGGETVVIPSGALAAGIQHSLRPLKIYKTGTTATGIVVYW